MGQGRDMCEGAGRWADGQEGERANGKGRGMKRVGNRSAWAGGHTRRTGGWTGRRGRATRCVCHLQM